MKVLILAATLAATVVGAPAQAADVGISVSIGQPGFYGQLDLGGYAQPPVVYPEPVTIVRGMPMDRPPIYLRVPPNQIKHWRKHCREYNACGERVFFVEDGWYNREYAPRYQEQHRDHRDDRRDERQDDRRDEHRDRDDGRGNRDQRDR